MHICIITCSFCPPFYPSGQSLARLAALPPLPLHSIHSGPRWNESQDTGNEVHQHIWWVAFITTSLPELIESCDSFRAEWIYIHMGTYIYVCNGALSNCTLCIWITKCLMSASINKDNNTSGNHLFWSNSYIITGIHVHVHGYTHVKQLRVLCTLMFLHK